MTVLTLFITITVLHRLLLQNQASLPILRPTLFLPVIKFAYKCTETAIQICWFTLFFRIKNYELNQSVESVYSVIGLIAMHYRK
jgi:hypothetical protein